jgi:putative nucleotidyltransferase with HDIG domain
VVLLQHFFVNTSNRRNNLSFKGVIIGLMNVTILASSTLIHRAYIENILFDSFIVFLNGMISVVFTIGILPTIESIFDVITPIKLLELSNPNQPLIKRLLIEAPGTYHHSLMVGNLAEAGAEAIGANPLLARVGAYFHDIGKLKRPNFFMENQLSDNPHDRMTPNLSSLVITSHTQDGVELAKKHHIPRAIRDIIYQHHGTTLIAFFYYKAKKSEKGDLVTEKNFRYPNSEPLSNEAAVVMLADCVEAAIRSLTDKTEGKIEGLIRKIIKSKLEDGQLDKCNLTFKDLDNVAKAFMKIFSGYFHARDEYPTKPSNDNKPKIEGSEPKPADVSNLSSSENSDTLTKAKELPLNTSTESRKPLENEKNTDTEQNIKDKTTSAPYVNNNLVDVTNSNIASLEELDSLSNATTKNPSNIDNDIKKNKSKKRKNKN